VAGGAGGRNPGAESDLDVATGTDTVARQFAGRGCRVVGLDQDEAMLRSVKRGGGLALVLPGIGLVMSRDWYRAGKFVGPSICRFWRAYPLDAEARPRARSLS
jgi:hypothetical protein